MSVDASNVIIDVVETKVDSFMDKIKDTIENIHDAIPGISFSPEVCNALKLLVAENPEVFSSMENTLNAIIADDKIDSRDVPHLLLLVKKVYDLARNRKDVLQKVDVYDMVKGVLRLLIVIFMKRNSKNTAETVEHFDAIISSAIELIRIQNTISGGSCFKICGL
jgi:hypothetical protein